MSSLNFTYNLNFPLPGNLTYSQGLDVDVFEGSLFWLLEYFTKDPVLFCRSLLILKSELLSQRIINNQQSTLQLIAKPALMTLIKVRFKPFTES